MVSILRGDCQPSERPHPTPAPLSGNMTSHFMTEIMPVLYVRLRAGMHVNPLSLPLCGRLRRTSTSVRRCHVTCCFAISNYSMNSSGITAVFSVGKSAQRPDESGGHARLHSDSLHRIRSTSPSWTHRLHNAKHASSLALAGRPCCLSWLLGFACIRVQ